MEIINLGADDGLPPVDWAQVTEKLDDGSAPAPDAHNAGTTWLATVNEDGSPHVTAVGALWLDGAFWFQTGSGTTRKASNVGRDARCSISLSIRDADVVMRVTPSGRRRAYCEGMGGQRLANGAKRERFGHHCPVQRASQGPPPWHGYRVEPRSATVALSAEPGGLTRF